MRKEHPFRNTMLAISRRMQRSGYSVAYTKHGDQSIGVPDPPAGAAWIMFTEQDDCQGMNAALGKLGIVESVRGNKRTCYELPEERGAACVVDAGNGTGYLYLSELGPVEETRANKLGSLLESIRGQRQSEQLDESMRGVMSAKSDLASIESDMKKIREDLDKVNTDYSDSVLLAFDAIAKAHVLLADVKHVMFWDARNDPKRASEAANQIKHKLSR